MPADPVESNDPFGLSRLDDPEFEAKERARLMGIDKGDTPSPEVQQAFMVWINDTRARNHMTGNFSIQPDKLFFSHYQKREDGEFSNRTYYKHPSRKEFSGDDILADLSLNPKGDGNYFAYLRRYGEGQNFTGPDKTDSVDIQFSGDSFAKEPGLHFLQVSMHAEFEGRKLGIIYSSNGNLAQISLEPGNWDEKARITTDASTNSTISMQQLLESGTSSLKADKSMYQATYDKESGKIKLTRTDNSDDIKDAITVPVYMDENEKFGQLFPKPLLDNLNSSDTELDQTWKDITLETFGVKWDRPTPNPTP